MALIRKWRGKWAVDYRDSAGRRHRPSFETRREAETFYGDAVREARQATRCVVNPDITLTEYATRWLRQVASNVKLRSVQVYTNNLNLHLLPELGHRKVRQLHRGLIKDHLVAKLSAGASRGTVRLVHATVRNLLNAAVDDGVILANPAHRLGRQLRLVTPKMTHQEEVKALSREQLGHFLDAARQATPRYYPFFLALARTGLRLGEARALQWGDLDLTQRAARVARSISDDGKSVDTPKSGHGRTVDLSRQLVETLRHLEVTRKAETLRRGWREVPAWVFVNRLGGPLDADKVRVHFKHALKAAGLSLHFTPHSLRHSYASILLSDGVSPAYVQRQLGHATITLTVDTYGKWLPSSDKAAADRLDGPAGIKMVSAAPSAASGEGDETT
jgi:integrase